MFLTKVKNHPTLGSFLARSVFFVLFCFVLFGSQSSVVSLASFLMGL